MARNENLKIAYPVDRGGYHLLSFTKAHTAFIPPELLSGASYQVMQGTLECKDMGDGWKPSQNGITGDDLKPDQCLHLTLVDPDSFYENLLAYEHVPGMYVWIDPALKAEIIARRPAA